MSLGKDLAGSLAVDAYARAAQAQTLAATICEIDGVPLNELQILALAKATLQAFDGIELEFEDHLCIEAELRTARWLIGPA